MTSYNEIRDVILTKLMTQFPQANVYGEEDQQGFEPPAIFVQMSSKPGRVVNIAHREKNLLVDLSCFSNAAQPLQELWGVASGLDLLFCPFIEVGDRAIIVSDPQPEIVGGVLHYRFNLNFIDSLEEDQIPGYQEYELMAELELKEEY